MEAYNATIKGICDLAESVPPFFSPGRFPISDITMLSSVGLLHERPGRVIWELYKESAELQAEYSEVKLLWLTSFMPAGVAIRNKPVYTLEDIKGMKVNTGGPYGPKIFKAFGASPSTLPFPDTYMNLDKGVVDAATSTIDSYYSWKYGEVTKYFLEVRTAQATLNMFMNLEKWNSLPPDIQKILEELSGDYMVDVFDREQWKGESIGKELSIKEWGIEFIELTPEEAARWNQLLQPVRDEFVAELEAKGLPGRKIMDDYDRLWEEYRK